MKLNKFLFALAAAVTVSFTVAAKEPMKVIFDTDIPAFDFVVFKAYNH